MKSSEHSRASKSSGHKAPHSQLCKKKMKRSKTSETDSN